VLNPGGANRHGEIYRQVEQIPEVVESVVVGQEWQGDVRVVLFVKLRAGITLDEPLTLRIKNQIRRNASPERAGKNVAVATSHGPVAGRSSNWPSATACTAGRSKNVDALANPSIGIVREPAGVAGVMRRSSGFSLRM